MLSSFLVTCQQSSNDGQLGILLTPVVGGSITSESRTIFNDFNVLLGRKPLNHHGLAHVEGIGHPIPAIDHIAPAYCQLGRRQGALEVAGRRTTPNVRLPSPVVNGQGQGSGRSARLSKKALDCPAEAVLLIDAWVA